MAERPILMSAPMVRAILAGAKTQTRRVVNPQPVRSDGWVGGHYRERRQTTMWKPAECWSIRDMLQFCPYGQPGDLLWVREKWQADPPHDGTWAATAWAGSKPHALSEIPERFRHPRFCNYSADWLHGQIIWRPSIHMPRWASRITLRVTDVRVERLQEITANDARAEGCPDKPVPGAERASVDALAKLWFHDLWESINGSGSWDANPWVWVVSFERVGGGNG